MLYNNFCQEKVVTNHNTQLLVQKLFDCPMGLASALIAQISFLVKTALRGRMLEKLTFFKELAPRSRTYELRG